MEFFSTFLAVIMTIVSLFGSIQLNNDFTRKIPRGYEEITNVSYGESPQQVYDLSIPKGIGNELSISIYIHGGSWTGGDKDENYSSLKSDFEDRKMLEDMICAKLNFRTIRADRPEITCDTMLKDIDDGIRAIADYCAWSGITIKKALIWGESSGGHLAMMYCYQYRDKCAVNIGLCYSICGFVDLADDWYFTNGGMSQGEMINAQRLLSGTAMTLENRNTEEMIEARKKISPINYITSKSVPTIYSACGKDFFVAPSDAEKLSKTLKQKGVANYYLEFPTSNHCGRNQDDYGFYKLFDLRLEHMLEKYVKK